ncbi:MAG: hypothetical protein U5K70_04980 [Halodesulfurarchaeum sp.]|nr:hypothetical protein [Halodesulfurarchaeum sp.]
MGDDPSESKILPEIGDGARLYLDHIQSRKTEQANHALKMLQINLLIASILVAAPVLFQLQGLNQFELFFVNLYAFGGGVFWLFSAGAATSAFVRSRASLNPELTVFENYLSGEINDKEFREYIGATSNRSKQTSGECFWLLTISAASAVIAVIFFGLSVVDSVTSGSVAYLHGLWPLLGLLLLTFVPSTLLGLVGQFRPDSVYLSFDSENLEEYFNENKESEK